MYSRRLPFLGLLAAAAAAGPALAGTIGLEWNPAAGAMGYRVHWGPASGDYIQGADVGSATEFVLDDLDDCTDYFVSVTAYNDQGESPFSDEIQGWAAPEIDSNVLPVFTQGGVFTMNLVGRNFGDDAELLFDAQDYVGNPLVRVGSLDVISCHEIEALVYVEPGARGLRAMEVGDHSLRVRNADGVFGASPYRVRLDTSRLDINRSDATTLDRVDGKDLVWLAFSYASAEGNEQFNADADVDGDGTVDGEDLALLAASFGSCWTGAGWSVSCP